jgi:hypothetical protein
VARASAPRHSIRLFNLRRGLEIGFGVLRVEVMESRMETCTPFRLRDGPRRSKLK